MIENPNELTQELRSAVKIIKTAILQSQARAARMISGSQLSLYFGVGLYVSANSREGTWGTGAIKSISEQLQRELPGLRGFSEESIKKMRTFAEFWAQYINRSPLATELIGTNFWVSVSRTTWRFYTRRGTYRRSCTAFMKPLYTNGINIHYVMCSKPAYLSQITLPPTTLCRPCLRPGLQ